MDSDYGGLSSSERQRQTAAEIARKKVLAAYSSTVPNVRNLANSPRRRSVKAPYAPNKYPSNTNSSAAEDTSGPAVQPNWQAAGYQSTSYERQPIYSQPTYNQSNSATTTEPVSALKDTPVNNAAVTDEWKKYHSAWQDYYKNYYNDYYAKAAQTYIATEKLKNERVAEGKIQRLHHRRRLIPIFAVLAVILVALFLQYNRLIFAPIMAYVSPDTGSVSTSLEAIDPTITETISPDPRLIIPKLNIDVPVAFNISPAAVDEAMNHGVAQFMVPGANALPGQIGNLVITGHSAGDIYSYNPYKFIFSGLERLQPGDLIYVNYESTRYTYQMTRRETVEPTNVAALVYETDRPMLTLITCTPLGTSRYRLLITAEQISPSYNADNIAAPSDGEQDTDFTMPANEPSFFENLWGNLFGR